MKTKLKIWLFLSPFVLFLFLVLQVFFCHDKAPNHSIEMSNLLKTQAETVNPKTNMTLGPNGGQLSEIPTKRAAILENFSESTALSQNVMARGNIVDASGQPVRGLWIQWQTKEKALAEERIHTQTNSDGSFACEIVVFFEKQGNEVEELAGNFISLDPGWVIFDGAYEESRRKESRSFLLVAEKATQIRGEVVDEVGNPLAGASVEISTYLDESQSFPDSLLLKLNSSEDRVYYDFDPELTDERGQFSIFNIPQLEKQALGGMVELGGFHRRSWRPSDCRDALESCRIVLERRETEEPSSSRNDPPVESQASFSMSTVRGVVVDEEGKAISGASLALDQSSSVLAITNEDGQFSLGISSCFSSLDLCVSKIGYRGVKIPASIWGPYSIQSAGKGLSVVLGSKPIQIQGRIVDIHHQPLSGFQVSSTESSPGGEKPIAITTNELGIFSLPFPVEGKSYGLKIQREDFPLRVHWYTGSEFAGDIPVPYGDLLDNVRGRVVTRQGKALSEVFIGMRIGDRGYFHYKSGRQMETNEAGFFTIWNAPKMPIRLMLWEDAIFRGEYAIEVDLRELVGELTIVVPMRCKLKVECSDPALASSFAVFDEHGKRVLLDNPSSDKEKEMAFSPLVKGKSPEIEVSDLAQTLVLYHDNEEVQRIPLKLQPGGLTVVRF